MITMREREFKEFDLAWGEAVECFARIKQGKARIVTGRGKGGRIYRYTESIRKVDS